ncbi:MAG: tail fiber domain-containing protein [Candidatus Pacebacteria bacterium]|nr:tail fiber domain-containing protein [Candidatus Paceibacterota bacterium]
MDDVLNITGSSNVGIGTTAPSTKLQVNGDIRVGTSGINGCIQNFAGTGLTGTCSSDDRLKTNITEVPSLLDRFSKLRLVNYN